MTHLSPRYAPDWGRGQLHLEGEFDFPHDLPARDVYEDFTDRAEVIGGFVTHSSSEQYLGVYPWNGPGHFRLYYDDWTRPITEIAVHDGDDDEHSRDPVSGIIKRGEAAYRLLNAATDDEPEQD